MSCVLRSLCVLFPEEALGMLCVLRSLCVEVAPCVNIVLCPDVALWPSVFDVALCRVS